MCCCECREDVVRAVALVEDGRRLRYLARVFGTSLGSIHRAMQFYRELGTYDRRRGSGRRRSTIVDHGTLNAQRYIEEILEDHVMPFALFIGQNFILIHDNALTHTFVIQYLQEVGIRALDWPVRSPDICKSY
ncbi:hypothetical protein ANN_13776 [Periplaneta americana]|uniref:Uncharacterized protein n=1 Tax=Periplaneta americana TaxID=6978 RepID=A0ABQ8SVG5_PERAM|nr:hypothetical protein ANN_13776 [Periplaneta americana]